MIIPDGEPHTASCPQGGQVRSAAPCCNGTGGEGKLSQSIKEPEGVLIGCAYVVQGRA